MSEKTEEASPQKIREARESGEVAKSTDLISAVQCLTIFLFVLFRGRDVLSIINGLITATIGSVNFPEDRALNEIANASRPLLLPISEFIGSVVIVTILASIGQTGLLVTPTALVPKWEKLNVATNAKQIFSNKSIVQFIKTIIKMSLVGVATFLIIRSHIYDLQFVPVCAISCGFSLLLSLLRNLFIAVLLITILIGVADFSYERYSYLKRLRMSKEDKKEETKNSEGDPEIKRERKKIYHEIQSGSLTDKIKKTSVIIRNPIHLAVCLQYDPQSAPVPRLLEKGQGNAARRIVSLAERYGIPMVEDVALARSIFKEVALNETIPYAFFGPVAAILRSIEDERILKDN
jgi:type III secretion protein U